LAPRYEIETAATRGPSRECRFGNSDKLLEPFVTMKPAGLSFGLSIWRSIKRGIIDAG
jgi:nitrogen fixation/metabolism regulation signal transduction histidine kinase